MSKSSLIERYQKRFSEREAKLKDFYNPAGKEKLLILQRTPGCLWGACNSIGMIVENNLKQFDAELSVDWSDEIPYLEPWIGTGVYASAFGCEYVFRDDAAPHVHYRYHNIEEVRGIEYPDWRKSPVMQMVLDSIDALKSATDGKLPIALTDTQSAFDTATLVLDAAEFFASCYLEEELVMNFMEHINNLIIEFSREQAKRIGHELLSKPGHIMPSWTGGPGISISDDNLAVSSPLINERISLPFDKKLADAFGGLAVHSCGVWSHTMRAVAELGGTVMIDCAVHKSCDPNPNSPSAIRDALKGTGIIVKIRGGNDLQAIDKILEDIYDPSLRYVVDMPWSKDAEETSYKHVKAKFETLATR